jgi:dCTP deaminase
MILCDREIKKLIGMGSIGISPYDPAMVQPASIDLRLDHHFREFPDEDRYEYIDPAREQPMLTRTYSPNTDRAFMLYPGQFALASTMETVSVPAALSARLEGKSSLGRLGLMTHITAGYIDPGFHGQITLELYNVAPLPLALYPGMKIAQLIFSAMSEVPDKPYGSGLNGSHYQGQTGPTPSRSWMNFHLSDTRAVNRA